MVNQSVDTFGKLSHEFGVTPAARSLIFVNPPKGDAETEDLPGCRTIQEALVAGYRTVLWVAVGLSLVSALSAATLIGAES